MQTIRTRVMGSAACAMAYVASGGVDAFCHLGLHCWDLAAGQLIILEAGGFLCDYGGYSIISSDTQGEMHEIVTTNSVKICQKVIGIKSMIFKSPHIHFQR